MPEFRTIAHMSTDRMHYLTKRCDEYDLTIYTETPVISPPWMYMRKEFGTPRTWYQFGNGRHLQYNEFLVELVKRHFPDKWEEYQQAKTWASKSKRRRRRNHQWLKPRNYFKGRING